MQQLAWCQAGSGQLPSNWSVCAGLFVETVHPVYGGAGKEGRRRRAAGLKRLDFVRAYSEYYWAKANGVAAALYANSRALMPAALEGSLRAVEDKVSELGQPLLAAVQSRSEQVLTSLDRKARGLPPPLTTRMCIPLCRVCVRARCIARGVHRRGRAIGTGAADERRFAATCGAAWVLHCSAPLSMSVLDVRCPLLCAGGQRPVGGDQPAVPQGP